MASLEGQVPQNGPAVPSERPFARKRNPASILLLPNFKVFTYGKIESMETGGWEWEMVAPE